MHFSNFSFSSYGVGVGWGVMWEVEGMLLLEGEKLWSLISTLPDSVPGAWATLEGTHCLRCQAPSCF